MITLRLTFIEIIASFSADIIISLFANSLQIVHAQ